ncbi:MAG: hypothetical protein IJW32_00655 [Clostridia bacterium]|nr:hypothetical protein [Clostridia bacterium]
MPIEEKTTDYKTHKHRFNVYVDLNTKTRLGENLLQQYHEETKRHCMDIGRIGYHDHNGRYVIDFYTTKELIVVPKLIIRVTERAVDRAGKDVYQLRTYMSKFGQLNFLLTVDRDKAELFLVENIYIENMNHREDYETLLFKLTYFNQKPVPLREIFYKFGIKANPDDYGKSWKEEDVCINNILVSKAKAEMTKQMANSLASAVNQKALVASLNYLNKEGDFGKKVTASYSQKVANQKEINKLATSPKLENTLNNVLIKTLEEQVTKKDLTDGTNFRVYKKVLDVQMTCPFELSQTVEKANTKDNLKSFLVEVYQKPKGLTRTNEDEGFLSDQKHAEFQNILDIKYDRRINKENYLTAEEVFEPDSLRMYDEIKEYKDFQGKDVEVNLDATRFENPENKAKKKQREKQEKQIKKQEKQLNKIKNAQRKKLKRLNAECNLDAELEKSKTALGLEPNDKKKKKKQLEMFFDKKKEKSKKLTKEEKLAKAQEDSAKNESLIKKLEKRIKNQNSKKEKVEAKKTQKEIKKIEKNQKKLEKEEEKRKKINNIFALSEDKKKKKQKINTADPIYNKESKQEKQNQQRPTVLSNLKQKNENEHKESAIKSFYENKKVEKTAAPIIKPQVEVKPKQEEAVIKQPAAPAKPSTKAVYINPLNENPQQKQTSHFDFVTGKRVAGTQKERTQDM